MNIASHFFNAISNVKNA